MHQHVSQLKIKYKDMLLNQEKERHKINKEQLKEQGLTYELQAQFDSLSKLQQQGKESFQASRDKNDDFKRKSEMQKKDEERKKMDLEQEVQQMTNQYKKDSDLKHKNWESITKYTNNEENEKRRHEKITKEYIELIKLKTEHKKKEEVALAAAQKAYEDFTSAKRLEITELTKEMNSCNVKLKASVIKLEGMDESLRTLKEKIESLDIEKKNLEQNNEQQKVSVKAKEELDEKKRQQQIQRDKNPEILDKQSEQETLNTHLQSQTSALTAEKQKHDNLQEQNDSVKEQIKIRDKKFKEDEEEVKKQDAALLVLQTKIDAELLIQKDQTEKLAQQLLLNEKLEKKQREEALKFVALEQQIIWIQKNTDFKNNVKAVDMAVFKELVDTNNEVNKSLAGLEVKMIDAKKGVNEMETKWQLAQEMREATEKKK